MEPDPRTRKAQVRAAFEQIAPDYDAGPGCFAHFGKQLVAEAELAPGQRVLDLATGRGALLFPAAEAIGGAGLVVGSDLARGMIRATRDEAARRGLRASCQVMDAEMLAFPARSFDRVLCGFGIMFFPQLDQALSEIRRVLRPGGRLALSTWRATQAADLEATLASCGLLDTAQGVLRFAEPDDLARTLEHAGFSVLSARTNTATFRYANLDEYWRNARGTGLRPYIDRLDAAQEATVRAALTARVAPHRRADGLYLAATAVFAVATN